MADIVERLLNPANVFYEYVADEGAMLREAADEIERLRKALQSICNCSTKMDYRKTSNRLDETYRIARKALGEKE